MKSKIKAIIKKIPFFITKTKLAQSPIVNINKNDNDDMNIFLEQVADTIEKNAIEKKSFIEVDNISLSQKECVYIVDFNQQKIVFNKGFYNLLGYDNKEITLELIESLYHPEDTKLINKIIKNSILHCLAHPEDSLNNNLFFSFRLRKKSGSYIKILSQSYVYDFNKENGMSSTLIKFTDISFIDNTKNVYWEFKAPNLNEEAFKQRIQKKNNAFFTKKEI
ncbi:MAG: PAS domain-containing protein, partial [Flavobacteriaceae bacterium]|nr:PAS domain-containing protein [Flavobacteriaceae bacterium]